MWKLLFKPANRIRKVKTKNSQEVLHRLEEYLNGSCEEPAEILCGFWKDQQDAITYQEIRQMILDGTVNQEVLDLWMQDYSILVAERLRSMWTNAVAAGPTGQPILDGLAFEFNTQTPGILSWLSERGAKLVTSCTQEQKNAIAALVTNKMKESHTVDELARLIRPCIGLTEGQAKANARYYDNIVVGLKKDHPRMKAESIRQKALAASTKYAERQHRERAFTIAQTESAFAYNKGADAGIRQAQSQELIGIVIKRWSTSGDDGVCDICAALDGTEVDMDSDFTFRGKILFAGQHMLPPAHPRCACAVEYIEDEKPKLSSNGFSVENETEVPEHDPPKYLESLDDISEDTVQSMLRKCEEEIVNSDIENAVVVSKSGLVWQCFGNKDNVFPDIDLGDELCEAWVTHNHPVDSANEYSFSKDDIKLFMEYNLKTLRCIDEHYVYELTRNVHDIDVHIPISDWDEFNTRHDEVISIAEYLGIGYRRYLRDK